MSGQFVIQDLDESLIFTVLFAANGYNAFIETEVDPDLEPLEVKLTKVKKGLPADHTMTGVVVDHRGKPVFGAQVAITGASQGHRVWGGRVKNVDKVAITNEKGEFLLTSREAFKQWSLEVGAAGFVNHNTEHLDTGDKKHKIQLDPGCTVVGTVENQKGDPVPNLQVGICQTDRGSDTFVGEYIIMTDQNGRFEFNSVLAKSEFTIYSKLVNDDEIGMFEIEAFKSSKSESTRDLGVFKVDQSATCGVKGRLILTDNQPLPKGMRFLIGRANAWDSQNVDVAEDGTFEIKGLAPNEDYEIAARVKGYRLSTKRNKYQQTQPWELSLHIEKDIERLEIYFEPTPKTPEKGRLKSSK